MSGDIPYRIEIADGPVLRCWEPRDAPLLKDAVDSSLEHLRAWMPWAHDEPQTLDEKAELLRIFRGNFDLGQDFVYGIFSADESKVLGGTGLHTRVGAKLRDFYAGRVARRSVGRASTRGSETEPSRSATGFVRATSGVGSRPRRQPP